MGLLLAPLTLALLALCRAAPLHSKPQAVITFPGELLSAPSDMELAEVRAVWPQCGPFPPPGPTDFVGLQAGLGAAIHLEVQGLGPSGDAVWGAAPEPSCLAEPLRLPFLPRTTCCASATSRRQR